MPVSLDIVKDEAAIPDGPALCAIVAEPEIEDRMAPRGGYAIDLPSRKGIQSVLDRVDNFTRRTAAGDCRE
jgi:hypothetical protein